MSREKAKRRVVPTSHAHPQSILQVMPQHRARIDPSVIPDLCHWLYALRQRYETRSRQGWRGADSAERTRRKGEALWARQMIDAIDAVERSLYETVELRDIDESRRIWEDILRAASGG